MTGRIRLRRIALLAAVAAAAAIAAPAMLPKGDAAAAQASGDPQRDGVYLAAID